MAVKTRDENITAVDRNIERVITKLMSNDASLDRASACKLVMQRAVRFTTQRTHRQHINVNNLVLE